MNEETSPPTTGAPSVPTEDEPVDVSIVMPCLNEALTLPECLKMAHDALDKLAEDGLSGEIVIADNGSTDGSQEIATKAGARVVPVSERGYGNALRYGLAAAHGRFLVMGDADASYDFREAVAMVRKLREGYELCMGTRLKGKIMPGAMPWKNRYIGNPALTGFLNLFFRSGLSDAHCGLRAFTKDAFRRMELRSAGMEFASEMVVRATVLDLKRTEVPATLHPDGRDRPPHLRPWHDGWRHLRFLLTYSPLWLFFLPSFALMGLSGLVLAALLFGTPDRGVFSLGFIRFGDHAGILAAGFFAIGHGGMVLGLAARRLHEQRATLPPSRQVGWFFRIFTPENGLLFAGGCLLLGAGLVAAVVIPWAQAGFGPLYAIREIALATTAFMVGLQTLFGGFLLALLADDQS